MPNSIVTRTLLLAALATAAVTPALADSWKAPRAERFVDAVGDRHVIVDTEGAFILARRAEGADPVTAMRDDEGSWKDSKIPVRDGDVVIARGTLPHRPVDLLVSGAGHGFVALDQWARCGYGKIVIVVDGSGKQTHALSLAQVFPDTDIDEAFMHTVSSIWWRRGGWIDDPGRSAVIVANGGIVRVLDLKTGQGRDGRDDDLLRGVRHPSATARNLALELVAEKETPGVEADVAAIVAAKVQPMSTRLRAALVLAKRGDPRGRTLFEEATVIPLADGVTKEDQKYAVTHLTLFLGDDALPVLREQMRGPAGAAWHSAQLGFQALGEKAVPTLLEMLAETAESSDYRGGAAHALGRIGSRTALIGLLAAVGDADEYTANAAANAAIKIGGDDCAEALVAHLTRGCTQDSRIAMYFEKVKYEPSIPALIQGLARAEKDFGRDRAADALQFQTGQELGTDVAAWRRWWKSRSR